MSVKAIVKKKTGKTRNGKGFSRDELREAGIDFQKALRLHLQIDQRRKTKHTENVKALKRLLKQS
jgi:ribosomal protein L13E